MPFNGITAVVHINAEPSFISLLQELKHLPGLGEGFLFFSQSGDISDYFSTLLDCCLERIKELYRSVRAHSTHCFVALDSLVGIIYLLHHLAWKELNFEKVDVDYCIILISPVMSVSYHRLHTPLSRNDNSSNSCVLLLQCILSCRSSHTFPPYCTFDYFTSFSSHFFRNFLCLPSYRKLLRSSSIQFIVMSSCNYIFDFYI